MEVRHCFAVRLAIGLSALLLSANSFSEVESARFSRAEDRPLVGGKRIVTADAYGEVPVDALNTDALEGAPVPGASGNRPVVLEHFTANWCPYCYGATNSIPRIQSAFSRSDVIIVSYHVFNDGYDSPYSNSRCSVYGINGVPAMMANGVVRNGPSATLAEGEAGIVRVTNAWTTIIQNEQQRNAAAQPFACRLQGSISSSGANMALHVDTVTGYGRSVNAIFLVTEDGIPVTASNGVREMSAVFRMHVKTQSFNLPASGQVTINADYSGYIPHFNASKLRPVVLLQDVTTKEIVGAAGEFEPEPVAAASEWWFYE